MQAAGIKEKMIKKVKKKYRQLLKELCDQFSFHIYIFIYIFHIYSMLLAYVYVYVTKENRLTILPFSFWH